MEETQEMWVQSLGWEDPLEEEMATHSSILVWKIPRMEETGGLQSMGSQRVGHNWTHKTIQKGSSLITPKEYYIIITYNIFSLIEQVLWLTHLLISLFISLQLKWYFKNTNLFR